MMSNEHGWGDKFAVAIAASSWSVRTQNSFRVHLPIAPAVIGLAAWLQIDAWRWVAVLFAITMRAFRGTAQHLDRATRQSLASGAR